MALIKLEKGAKITRSKIAGNKVFGGNARSSLIEAGEKAEIIDTIIQGNLHVSTKALRLASESLSRSKNDGETKATALKKGLTVMGHVANASGVAGVLGEIWDALSS